MSRVGKDESASSDRILPLLRQRDLALDADTEQRLHELLNALPAAVYTTDAAGRITFYNEAAAVLWGCRPTIGSDEWCGSWRLYWPDGISLPHSECPMAIALKEKRSIHGMEAAAERPDGTRIPFMAFPSPLRDSTGRIVGAVNMLVDISERKRAEETAQRLAAIVETSDDAIISKDLNGVIKTWNAAAERLFGYTAEEAIGNPVTILIPQSRVDEEPAILERLRRGERIDHYETVRRRKDGTLIDVSLTVSPVRDSAGRIAGASKIARDITERKRKEEQIALLTREVDHRSKNLLALVQATVHLSSGDTAEGIKASIAGRIQALSNAHVLLAQSRWEGAELEKLVKEELAPYCNQSDSQASVCGPHQVLQPDTAQSIAVALHELATNAVKYGALSVPTGNVKVSWSRGANNQLVICWSEKGGPPAKPPAHQGFGTRVIDRMIRSQLKGEIRFDWRPTGLVCEIEFPV